MRRINTLILFILIAASVSAQDSLRFTRTSYTLSNLNTSSFAITDSLYYLGSAPITDSITFGASANGLALNDSFYRDSTPILPSDTFYTGLSNFKLLTINVVDTAPHFVIGPNTIVIWPIIRNHGIVPFAYIDSIHIYATIDTIRTAGIAGSSLLRMYIFQTPGHLNINFGDAGNLVQQVRIYDILGQNIYAGTPDQSKSIPTAGWNTGIYLCEITTFTGEKRTIKFRLQ